MADQITNYQCPACTGPMHFAAGSGKLECDYCGSSFEVAEVEAMYAQKEQEAAEAMAQADEKAAAEAAQWDASGLTQDWGSEAAGMRSYSCPSCGAELICDQTTAATACPYCGNPTVVPGQFSGALRPDYVIPFKLEKKEAIEILKKHYKGKVLLPKTFTSTNTIEKIQGVYVPFWLYDGEAVGRFVYHGTRIRTFTRGDEQITETDHFNIMRNGSLKFEKVPVDASSKMPDAYMDSIEPFDYGQMVPFSTAYMPGFLADKYDVTSEQSHGRADERCKNTLENALRDTVQGFATCVTVSGNVQLKRGKIHYAMLPVWLLNVKWNKKDHLFAINGQTGKIAGDLPVDKGKMWGMFAAIAAGLSAIGSLLVCLITG